MSPQAPPLPIAAMSMNNIPYMRAANSLSAIYGTTLPLPAASIPGTFRTSRSSRSTTGRSKRRNGQLIGGSKSFSSSGRQKQRRKSDADLLESSPSFQYTGLDRTIADDYLAQQERIQHSNATPKKKNHINKTKIICSDVVM